MPWSVSRKEHYAGLIRAIHEAAAETSRATAEAVVKEALATAPVDTGALQGSGYVASKTPGALTYDEAVAWVQRHNPDATILPEVTPPAKDTEATAAWTVDYAAPAEYYAGPKANHPFAQPAIDRVRPMFERSVAELLRRARSRQ